MALSGSWPASAAGRPAVGAHVPRMVSPLGWRASWSSGRWGSTTGSHCAGAHGVSPSQPGVETSIDAYLTAGPSAASPRRAGGREHLRPRVTSGGRRRSCPRPTEPRGCDEMDDVFEAHRPRLHAVATRMLGSRAEADDAVQEAWLRINQADTSDVHNMGGWLTTVVSRVCLTMLDARKRRREEALEGGRLPDPVITRVDDAAPDPEGQALVADAVGAALLVVLETLQPAERL